MHSIVDQSKEVADFNVAPIKLRQNRMKALSTSEPAASQGILTVVSLTTLLLCKLSVTVSEIDYSKETISIKHPAKIY